MNYYDNETNIIESFQNSLEYGDVLCISNNEKELISILESFEPGNWESWTNSSAKNAPPPDFYNDRLELMMDVMRVDDHAREINGKIYNPTNVKESKIQKELRHLISQNKIPKCNKIIVNAISELPTNEDHNYTFYFKNFNRVIKNHLSKILNYKANHPNYKVIFFVFDESSEYVQVKSKSLAATGIKEGQAFSIVRRHVHYIDKNLINVFLSSDIDYLIWFAPFKFLYNKDGTLKKDMPCTVVYDIKNMNNLDCVKYDSEYMMSVEP